MQSVLRRVRRAAADTGMGRGLPTVAGYEIEVELGRGGMGVVYKARHLRLNRPCAIKMILAGLHSGPDVVARFVTEAEAIARLEHPSIVQIRHIGDADGLPFLELEYVSGGSLDQQLDGTPWPAMGAARLAEQVALGIAEAHRQGIVHRDLKPSNVLMAADGTPKVSDFGLAKLLDSTSALTRSESVMGSPSYMAPSRPKGTPKTPARPSMYTRWGQSSTSCLTGRPPFRGTTALETLEQVKTTEPVPPSQLLPGMPRDIETICLKCLQKEPGKRYDSAQALGDDLRRFGDGRPILARRVSGAERAWRWCRRNRIVAGMSAIAVVAILILAIGASIAAWIYRRQLDRIDRQLYIHRVNLAYRECLANNIAAADRLLDDCPPARRGWEWGYCRRICHEESLTLSQGFSRGSLLTAAALAFSPDGRGLAAAGLAGSVRFWDAETGRLTDELPGEGSPFFCLAFSPDGRHIAAGGRGTITIWETGTRRTDPDDPRMQGK